MEIQRVNDYRDPRFRETVLRQHGAFLVDGRPCGFEIVGPSSAKAAFEDGLGGTPPVEAIEEFRFYAEHITRFYGPQGELLKEYPPVPRFQVELDRIQPSQFFVDQDKLQAVSSFIHSERDVVIPLQREESGGYVSLDGHTRLALALRRGYSFVYGFLSQSGDSVLGFVEEARRRGIFHVCDMETLPHEQYEVQWNQFCDAWFANS